MDGRESFWLLLDDEKNSDERKIFREHAEVGSPLGTLGNAEIISVKTSHSNTPLRQKEKQTRRIGELGKAEKKVFFFPTISLRAKHE